MRRHDKLFLLAFERREPVGEKTRPSFVTVVLEGATRDDALLAALNLSCASSSFLFNSAISSSID